MNSPREPPYELRPAAATPRCARGQSAGSPPIVWHLTCPKRTSKPELQRSLSAILQTRNRVAHTERLFNPARNELSPPLSQWMPTSYVCCAICVPRRTSSYAETAVKPRRALLPRNARTCQCKAVARSIAPSPFCWCLRPGAARSVLVLQLVTRGNDLAIEFKASSILIRKPFCH